MKITTHTLPNHGVWKTAPHGICIHNPGPSIPDKIAHDGVEATEAAIAVYSKMAAQDGTGPHYVVLPAGEVVQLRDAGVIAWHAGLSSEHRANYLDGTWEQDYNRLPKSIVQWWKMRHPGIKSPAHLYPGKSQNEAYVGIEVVSCGVYSKNTWEPVLGTPVTAQGRYTAQQYTTLALLCLSIGKRFAFPSEWYTVSGRLVGHEDINPYTRPGWDPGAFRGWWSWSTLVGVMKGLDMHHE